MNKNNIKYVIIISVILLLIAAVYLVLKKIYNKEENYQEYLKNYSVNEYIPTYVSDEDMAKIYLNDYTSNMYFDIENAYNLLDSEYRDKKFGSIDNYKNYVSTQKYSYYKLEKYYKRDKYGYIFFGVYDNNENFYIFKTKGVMQYSVYLDENTVEIW